MIFLAALFHRHPNWGSPCHSKFNRECKCYTQKDTFVSGHRTSFEFHFRMILSGCTKNNVRSNCELSGSCYCYRAPSFLLFHRLIGSNLSGLDTSGTTTIVVGHVVFVQEAESDTKSRSSCSDMKLDPFPQLEATISMWIQGKVNYMFMDCYGWLCFLFWLFLF